MADIDIKRLRELLAMMDEYCEHSREGGEESCSNHPDAPHGFDRNGSHCADRYVCDCEGWEPDPSEVRHIAYEAVSLLREQGPALLALAEAVSDAPEAVVKTDDGDLVMVRMPDVVRPDMRKWRVRLVQVPNGEVTERHVCKRNCDCTGECKAGLG